MDMERQTNRLVLRVSICILTARVRQSIGMPILSE
jgi:hypothetical protein